MTPLSFHKAHLLALCNIFLTTILIVQSIIQGQSRLEKKMRASKEKSEMAAPKMPKEGEFFEFLASVHAHNFYHLACLHGDIIC